MSLKKIIPLACALVALGYLALADDAAQKVDYYAIPVVSVKGKAIKVSHALKDTKKKPSGMFLGVPKVIFKKDGKVVHEGAMKPG